ncbi:MAG: hypothetical protein ILP08_08220 [Lachnospiraceae bacterium]|nr:hypothetical protein [Lachnospiraceae bacterium]
MSVYLIDYENVNFSGLEGVGALNEGDEVVLFYSDSSSTIPMNLHIDVQRSGASMRYIEIRKTAKNYLDFQLAALSGYLVGTTDQTEFIVISRDSGFDSVLDLFNTQDFVGRKVHFSRQDSIGGMIPVKRRASSRKTAAKKPAAKKAVKPVEAKAPSKSPSENGKRPAENAAKALGTKKPDISNAFKAQIRLKVKDMNLKPTDYTKIYNVFSSASDKHNYDIGLIKAFKDQELGNRIYKATLSVFNGKG